MYSELLFIQQNARLATFQMFIIVCSISFLGSFCLLNVQQYFVFLAVKEIFHDHKFSEYASCNHNMQSDFSALEVVTNIFSGGVQGLSVLL